MSPQGTKQENDALEGKGLLQSEEEWSARNRILSDTLCEYVNHYVSNQTGEALDVGCETGGLTDLFAYKTKLQWRGLDPDVEQGQVSPAGIKLVQGYAHDMPFPDNHFDCIMFANVYEHVDPEMRLPSVVDMHRVLKPGGILVGQLPNPFFPLESHSRLPFLTYLPEPLRRVYWRLTPTGWDYDRAHFFVVSVYNLKSIAESHGFETLVIRNFNYALDAIPQNVRWIASLHSRLGVLPWAHQFVFRKK
jgi:SAM-dependent methyltransferase